MDNMVTHPRFYNDEWTIQDDLEFESLKKVLVKLINSRYTQTPITVGIHGAWGTGKTTLMRMVHKEIKKDNKVIWFDAWKFREIDDVWKGLIIEVLTQIGIKKNLKEKAKKLSVKLLRIGGIALVNKITNMNKDEIDSVINSVFENDMKSFRNEQKEFEQLIDEFIDEKKRLVLFIDDLDRCIPDEAIRVLNAIKLLLHTKKCIFVIGADINLIEKGVDIEYGKGIINGREYIEKLIQVPFLLPPIEEGLIINYINQLGILQNIEISNVYYKIGIFKNPRKIKRFTNTFNILKLISEERNLLLNVKEERLLFKLLIIQLNWIELYDLIVKETKYLFTLQDIINGDEELFHKGTDDHKYPELVSYLSNNILSEFIKIKPHFTDDSFEKVLKLTKYSQSFGTKNSVYQTLSDIQISENAFLVLLILYELNIPLELKEIPEYTKITIKEIKQSINELLALLLIDYVTINDIDGYEINSRGIKLINITHKYREFHEKY